MIFQFIKGVRHFPFLEILVVMELVLVLIVWIIVANTGTPSSGSIVPRHMLDFQPNTIVRIFSIFWQKHRKRSDLASSLIQWPISISAISSDACVIFIC